MNTRVFIYIIFVLNFVLMHIYLVNFIFATAKLVTEVDSCNLVIYKNTFKCWYLTMVLEITTWIAIFYPVLFGTYIAIIAMTIFLVRLCRQRR